MRIGSQNIRLLFMAGLSWPAMIMTGPCFADDTVLSEDKAAAADDAQRAMVGIYAVAAPPVAETSDRSTPDETAAEATPATVAAHSTSLEIQLPVIEPAPLSLNLEPSDFDGVETTATVKRQAPDRAGEIRNTAPVEQTAVEARPDQSSPSASTIPGAAEITILASSAAPAASDMQPAAPSLASEDRRAISATTVEIAGPDMPDAEIAKLILRKLASRKGKLDDSIAQFYETRANRPLWIEGDGLKPSVKPALSTLANAADHGMKPASYRVSIRLDTLDAQADTDIELSRTMLKYARDARGARLNPRKISSLITAEPTLPDTADALTRLAAASNLGDALVAFQPQQAGYQALQHKLAEIHRSMLEGMPAEGKIVGASSDDRLEKDIVANMERWRWLPPSLGDSHVIVNVPAYELKVVRDGQIVHQTKVIVGKPETPTPIFSHTMEYLIVNPYWNIPPSIALKEMLPQLRSDPYALQRKGFEIVKNGKTVDPSGVDWTGSVKNVRIRQPPGERNALGFIKFMFPNDHSVYLHDTPSRGLFARSTRAFSHGCVRVFEPFALANILLNHQNGLTERQLRNMIGSGERYIHLQNKLPVHIAYFTTFVDEAGTLQTKPDVYGHDAKVKAALLLAD